MKIEEINLVEFIEQQPKGLLALLSVPFEFLRIMWHGPTFRPRIMYRYAYDSDSCVLYINGNKKNKEFPDLLKSESIAIETIKKYIEHKWKVKEVKKVDDLSFTYTPIKILS